MQQILAVICGCAASDVWSMASRSAVTLKLVRMATRQPSPLFTLQQCGCDRVPRFADAVFYCMSRVSLSSFLGTVRLQNFLGFMARSPTYVTKLGKPRVLMAVKRFHCAAICGEVLKLTVEHVVPSCVAKSVFRFPT